MRTLLAALVFALLPLANAAVPGGHRCQVADSAVPTPGLQELAGASEKATVPAAIVLSDAQVERLAHLDTKLRADLRDIEIRAKRLPAGKPGAVDPKLAQEPLPALVERFVADAAREQALVIDVETASEFDLADANALAARKLGDKDRWCPLCVAVRRGLEADFAWRAGELGELSPAQAKEAAELAALREDVRGRWAAGLKAELRPEQQAWIQDAQMRWLKSTLHASVLGGMRSLGKEKCEACATKVEWKCEFCSIVLNALADAKAKS